MNRNMPVEHQGAPFPLPEPPSPPPPSEREKRLEQALKHIVEWSLSYPVKVFKEPDMAKAAAALEAAGMTVDAISAHAMRHVLKDAAIIAEDALGPHS